jgi:hypothetical protein
VKAAKDQYRSNGDSISHALAFDSKLDNKMQLATKLAFQAQCKTVYDDLTKLVSGTSKSKENLDDSEWVADDDFELQASIELCYDELHLNVLAMNATDDPILQAHTQNSVFNRADQRLEAPIDIIPQRHLPLKYQRKVTRSANKSIEVLKIDVYFRIISE